jgi:hypothetical protein
VSPLPITPDEFELGSGVEGRLALNAAPAYERFFGLRFACERSDPATLFTFFGVFGFRRSLAAFDASFLPVAIPCAPFSPRMFESTGGGAADERTYGYSTGSLC